MKDFLLSLWSLVIATYEIRRIRIRLGLLTKANVDEVFYGGVTLENVRIHFLNYYSNGNFLRKPGTQYLVPGTEEYKVFSLFFFYLHSCTYYQ